MNDEIKEILEDLKNKDLSVDDLTHNDKTKLLDCITNLQEENENLKQRLESKNAFIKFVNNKYRQRIDKAIEYMKKVSCNNNIYFYTEDTDDVLGDISKILGGDG